MAIRDVEQRDGILFDPLPPYRGFGLLDVCLMPGYIFASSDDIHLSLRFATVLARLNMLNQPQDSKMPHYNNPALIIMKFNYAFALGAAIFADE
eukprot:scaffold44159_cov68-Cyclotella_meneghiniana.AAC.7